MSGYFPYGFTYPEGFQYNEANPDPGMEKIRLRVEFLNEALRYSIVPDYVFAAALDLFQSHSEYDKDVFWDGIMARLSPAQVAELVDAIADNVTDAMPRLEFPNAIALFDCRFVSTKEWEHIRRYSIGGSEVAAVLGLSHYQSPRSLYFEKKAPVPDERGLGGQHILDYGHFVEEHICQINADLLGAIRYPEHRMFVHKDYPFISCNPDDFFLFPDGHLVLFEAKTAYRMKRDEWKAGIPEYYEPQPRQYLEVLNDPRLVGGYIGVCLGGDPNDRLCHKYQRDPVKGAEQIQKVVEYWQTYIVPGVLPPLCGKLELDMNAVYKYDTNNTHNANTDASLPDTAKDLFEKYHRIQAERKQLSKSISAAKKEEAVLEAQLRDSIPAELTICTNGNGLSYVLRVKESGRTSLNSAAYASVIPQSVRTMLDNIAAATIEPGSVYSTPKITKGAS